MRSIPPIKNFILFFLLSQILIFDCLHAQAPQGINYQGVARSANGKPLVNKTIKLRLNILNGGADGTSVYAETHSSTTGTGGLFNITIGAGTPLNGTFSAIDWSTGGSKWVKVEMDTTGGNNFQFIGSQQLMSVPYALYAKTSGEGFTHYIGEQFDGGIIFHLWKDISGLEHGLIVSPNDQSSAQIWSNVSATLIGFSAQSQWNGLSNCNSIISQAGHSSSAAALCLDLISGGQNDWYLPSIQELNLLWNNYYTVSRSISQIPAATQMAQTAYWSSTESIVSLAYSFTFYGGNSNANNKTQAWNVRAIRSF